MSPLRTAVLAAVAASLLAAPNALATPVKCAPGDPTPDGRVFPEPRLTTTFLRFDEFRCGTKLLEQQYPGVIQIRDLGTSKAGHPLFDIEMTDESVTTKKEKLLVVSSIHGNEVGGREGGAHVIEDMANPALLGNQPWVKQVLKQYVIHFVFPNPDGWVAGDIAGSEGAGISAQRGNDSGRDLNRQFPVKGWISTPNATLAEPEGNRIIEKLFSGKPEGWFLGTDNHGQGPDTYAAAGLQIVGQFDYQKSETLARFADGITKSMEEYGVLGDLESLKASSGQDLGAYHWGTLYDMLGYSASGSMIDYYNTVEGIDGTGFATELTAGTEVNWLTYPAALNQVWVDSIRAINYTMFRQAIDRKRFTFPVGGRAAYVFDPDVIRHDDGNGAGYARKAGEGIPQQPYSVTRMRFFDDLNRYADRPLDRLRVADVLGDPKRLFAYDSIVLANDALPEKGDAAGTWFRTLRQWVEAGGNLILTDAALGALPSLGVDKVAPAAQKHYVGFVDFTDRAHPLNAGLRGVARQTYDTVPIGYQFGGTAQDSAPNWKLDQAAWQAAGGTTQGTNGTGKTIYGELGVGKGRIRVLGALLPDPSEEYYHPYGLQNYAVTYTGYTLLQNMLKHTNPSRDDSLLRPPGGGSGPAPSPSSSGGAQPDAARQGDAARARPCVRRKRAFTVRIRLPRGSRTRSARVRVGWAKQTRPVRRRGRTITVRVRPARLSKSARAVRVRVWVRTRGGKMRMLRRTVPLCVAPR